MRTFLAVAAFAAGSLVGSIALAQSLTNERPMVVIWGESEATGMRRQIGSGFVLSPSGYTLTAKHVVDARVEGERLVASISTKSQYPVKVDMEDLGCSEETQDFCFIRVSPADIAVRNMTEFYRLGCYLPARGSPLQAAGFYSGEGVLTLPGELVGDPAEGGSLPTTIQMQTGMSGGPVFDKDGVVVGVVRGGFEGLGFLQPMQRAKSGLTNRGIDCLNTPQDVTPQDDTPPDIVTPQELKRLQCKLSWLEYKLGYFDGSYGPRTSAAIRRFKQDYGLGGSGQLDEVTIAAIEQHWTNLVRRTPLTPPPPQSRPTPPPPQSGPNPPPPQSGPNPPPRANPRDCASL